MFMIEQFQAASSELSVVYFESSSNRAELAISFKLLSFTIFKLLRHNYGGGRG